VSLSTSWSHQALTTQHNSATNTADNSVQAAVQFVVQSRVLYVGFSGSFKTKRPIRINISLPPGRLLRVSNRGMGDVIINPGET
jgi:hypothetical protein